ncbi:hypothetical protein WN944_018664 [Citrus x changshan-huyou]|uniref:Uncharacterized protein n=1 Tax=Citrus x changshan-huyou TaxID=2935761 RepID=A0AAP0LWR2_9ROSI
MPDSILLVFPVVCYLLLHGLMLEWFCFCVTSPYYIGGWILQALFMRDK